MNKEKMQNNYIEMLIQDLEKHSFDYWESTQDEMVEALRNLQQKVKQLEKQNKEFRRLISHYYKYASDQEGKFVLAKAVTDWLKIWLREMLDNSNDNFSVVRVKDVLYKIEELEREINYVQNIDSIN